MKTTLFTVAIFCFAAYGCKKSSQPESIYTKQVAGTRKFIHISDWEIGAPHNPQSVDTDTVTLNIQYVNAGTIEINSTILTYSPGKSTDSTVIFFYTADPSGTGTGITAQLYYSPVSNSIYYSVYDFVSSGGQGTDTYQSL